MFEDCGFIEEVNKEGFNAVIQETADAHKKIMFTCVDNEVYRTEVIEWERRVYRDKQENVYTFSAFYSYRDISFERVKKTITVLTWKIESGDVVFTCFVGGKIEVVDFNKLFMLCFSCDRYFSWGELICDFTKSERVIEIHSLKGVHNFNFDLYSRLNARKLYKIKEGLNAKYALLGFGEILFSDKGELIRLTAGRQGVLKIPDTCKVIKYNSIDLRNASILKVGAGVEKCEEYPFFYIEADIQYHLILEFNDTSAEIVSKLFLEIFFHTYGGESIIRRTTMKVAKGLTDVLWGLIFSGLFFSAMEEKFYGLKREEAYIKEVKKYFESWSEFNICKDITKEQVIGVLDNIAEYIEKNIEKMPEYTTENIDKYGVFADIVLAFESSFVGFLTEEEYRFYGKALGAIEKFRFRSG